MDWSRFPRINLGCLEVVLGFPRINLGYLEGRRIALGLDLRNEGLTLIPSIKWLKPLWIISSRVLRVRNIVLILIFRGFRENLTLKTLQLNSHKGFSLSLDGLRVALVALGMVEDSLGFTTVTLRQSWG